LAPYDCGEKLKAVSRLPETCVCCGSVTGETATLMGTVVGLPSATTWTEPLYVPAGVPYGTVTWSQTGWFVCSAARCEPSQGRSASGTGLPSTET
jgi:uncharacterized RmlC-like cupin family protein